VSMRGRLLLLLLALAPVAYAQDEGEGKPAVSVRFQPATAIEPSMTVAIEGVSPLDGQGEVTLRIVKPRGNEQTLKVKPSANGDYSVNFTGTDEVGSYAVEATSPGGKMRGKGSFEVAVQEPLDDIEEAHEEAEKLAEVIDNIVADLGTQLEKLPDSPARDEVKAKWSEIKPKMQAAAKDLRDTRSLTAPFADAVNSDPKLKPALKPLARELANWQTKSVAERERILGELARSRSDSVTCESIERVVEGFNLASALFNLAGGPAAAVKAVVIDYLASKGAALASKISAKHGFSVNESSKIALAVGEAKLKGIFQLEKVSLRAATKEAVQSNVAGLASDLLSFVATRVFAKFCERLAGQFSGGMLAEFNAKDGRRWWSYTIEFEGRLDLRYAKGMTSGKAVVVKGDFLGQATKFTLWEDALRIGWPGLTSGAILYKRAVLPQPQAMNLLTGQLTNPNGSLKEEKPIEVEGKAAAVFVKPYSFFVPVEGEIVDGVLTLRRQPATVDYTAAARVVYVVVSPLSAMLGPQFTAFELPYKSGGFFIERAFGDSGIRTAVTKTSKGFVVDETFKREKGNGVANGTYKLKLKLCNPEGSC
jgi:hypothetical protein